MAGGDIQEGPVGILVEAATARLLEVNRELEVLRDRAAQVETQMRALSNEALHLEALLSVHGAAKRGDDGLAPSRDVRDEVVKLITERGPLHYRQIERELRQRGIYTGGGKDPANALLARYFDDPRLYRPGRGVYALNDGKIQVHSVGRKRRRRSVK